MTKHKIINFFQTLLIVTIMLSLMGLIGLVIGGVDTVLFTLVFGIVLIMLFPTVSPALIARLYGAKPLFKEEAPELYAYVRELCIRAEVKEMPLLYLVSNRVMFAFSVGRSSDAIIVLSHGLINKLESSEIVGVLAHETAHIVNKDLWLMSMTDFINRLMAVFSLMGQILILLFLPAYIFMDLSVPWLGIAILIFAPFINSLLLLFLSRIREYDADFTAAYLMGTARPLAEALRKIDEDEKFLMQRIFFSQHEHRIPAMFRTHPKTKRRIEKLNSIKLPEHIHKMHFYYGARLT